MEYHLYSNIAQKCLTFVFAFRLLLESRWEIWTSNMLFSRLAHCYLHHELTSLRLRLFLAFIIQPKLIPISTDECNKSSCLRHHCEHWASRLAFPVRTPSFHDWHLTVACLSQVYVCTCLSRCVCVCARLFRLDVCRMLLSLGYAQTFGWLFL